jgi:hypothetical protein
MEIKEILQDINFYKLALAIFIPLLITYTIIILTKKKKK